MAWLIQMEFFDINNFFLKNLMISTIGCLKIRKNFWNQGIYFRNNLQEAKKIFSLKTDHYIDIPTYYKHLKISTIVIMGFRSLMIFFRLCILLVVLFFHISRKYVLFKLMNAHVFNLMEIKNIINFFDNIHSCFIAQMKIWKVLLGQFNNSRSSIFIYVYWFLTYIWFWS